MRELEPYRGLRVDAQCWLVLRLDGRGFSRFGCQFDQFSAIMEQVVRHVVSELQARLAYSHTDEISLLFPPGLSLFQRRLEKMVSLSASLAASAFTASSGQAVAFDSRAWVGQSLEQVVDYFDWRQQDGHRCSLSQARNHSLDLNEAPLWRRRGFLANWEQVEKVGFNPLLQQEERTVRRRLSVNRELPHGPPFRALVQAHLTKCVDLTTNGRLFEQR